MTHCKECGADVMRERRAGFGTHFAELLDAYSTLDSAWKHVLRTI